MQPEAAAAVHIVMTGIGRLEVKGLSRIGADRFRAKAEHLSLIDQKLHRFSVGARRVLTCLIEILIRNGVGPFRPISSHQNPRSRGNPAVAALPLAEQLNGQENIGIGRGPARTVDHTGRCDEALRWNRIGAVIRQMPAGNPMDRRIEMGTGVLTAGKVVPVPTRSAGVIPGCLLDAERPGLSHFRG